MQGPTHVPGSDNVRRAFLPPLPGQDANALDDQDGTLQRCLRQVLQEAARRDWTVRVCALQIYNEKVFDMLHEGDTAERAECDLSIVVKKTMAGEDERTIVRHKDKGPLVEVGVESTADAMHKLSAALQSRIQRATRYALPPYRSNASGTDASGSNTIAHPARHVVRAPAVPYLCWW